MNPIRQGIVKKVSHYVYCSASNYKNNFGIIDIEVMSSPHTFVDSKQLNMNYGNEICILLAKPTPQASLWRSHSRADIIIMLKEKMNPTIEIKKENNYYSNMNNLRDCCGNNPSKETLKEYIKVKTEIQNESC